MSPERDIQERRRIRAGRRKAQEKKFPPLVVTKPEDRIRRLTMPSRASLLDKVDLETRDNPEVNKLVFDTKHRGVLLDFIDATIAHENGDDTSLIAFKNKINPNSKNFNGAFSRRANMLSEHFNIVLDSFSKPPTPEELIRRGIMESEIEKIPNYESVIKPYMEAIMDFFDLRRGIFDGANSVDERTKALEAWSKKHEAKGPLPDEINPILGFITSAFDEAAKNRLRK